MFSTRYAGNSAAGVDVFLIGSHSCFALKYAC